MLFSLRSQLLRRYVSGNRKYVISRQIRDHFLHQRRRHAVVRAGLKSIDLAADVGGMESRDPGNVTQAFEGIAVTNSTSDRFARACRCPAGFNESRALRNAAHWNVGDKPRVWIAASSSACVLRKLDDA